jgi:hypothetical protein
MLIAANVHIKAEAVSACINELDRIWGMIDPKYPTKAVLIAVIENTMANQ